MCDCVIHFLKADQLKVNTIFFPPILSMHQGRIRGRLGSIIACVRKCFAFLRGCLVAPQVFTSGFTTQPVALGSQLRGFGQDIGGYGPYCDQSTCTVSSRFLDLLVENHCRTQA